MYHAAVLLAESIEGLAVRPGGAYLDGTAGGGGHLQAIIDQLGGTGTAIGLDRDPDAIAHLQRHIEPRGAKLILAQSRFSELDRVCAENGVEALDGVLLDLGVSSYQLDTPERGFSYQVEAPLDMRMDPQRGTTAAQLLRESDVVTLERILRDYGEVTNAPRMARTIASCARTGSLETTADLRSCLEAEYGPLKPKVLSKVFQALRIAVNRELEELETFLAKVAGQIRTGGRLAVIAYHSLEDRLVKNAMRDWEGRCICPPELPVCRCGRRAQFKRITRRAVTPSDAEIRGNRRARSARLRIAERVAT
ncbi:MAG: 16S rRNA (cytosine(1402)-N(4))-methyltransferase RsmH [Chitinivibrionales bacterium]|nr:16S rRNA (cytosine(1402)-N(4))-methyltransferase RsmH [Chitinivibrionales bacterium]